MPCATFNRQNPSYMEDLFQETKNKTRTDGPNLENCLS